MKAVFGIINDGLHAPGVVGGVRRDGGEAITGKDEDELVDLTQAHLASVHPGLEYDRDSILFMAY